MQYVYGIHAVDSLLRENPKSVQHLLLQVGREDKRIASLLALANNQGVSVLREPRAGLDKLVNGRHQGVVALLLQGSSAGDGSEAANLWDERQLLTWVENKGNPLLILVLDGVTDPHNLGACLRSADAAGVDAVVVPRDKSADLTAVARKGRLRRGGSSAVRAGNQHKPHTAGIAGAGSVVIRHKGRGGAVAL